MNVYFDLKAFEEELKKQSSEYTQLVYAVRVSPERTKIAKKVMNFFKDKTRCSGIDSLDQIDRDFLNRLLMGRKKVLNKRHDLFNVIETTDVKSIICEWIKAYYCIEDFKSYASENGISLKFRSHSDCGFAFDYCLEQCIRKLYSSGEYPHGVTMQRYYTEAQAVASYCYISAIFNKTTFRTDWVWKQFQHSADPEAYMECMEMYYQTKGGRKQKIDKELEKINKRGERKNLQVLKSNKRGERKALQVEKASESPFQFSDLNHFRSKIWCPNVVEQDDGCEFNSMNLAFANEVSISK
jgi:hypothetical protein